MAFQNIVDSWICGNREWVYRELEKISDKKDFVLWLQTTEVPKQVQFELYEWYFWKSGKATMYIDVEGRF